MTPGDTIDSVFGTFTTIINLAGENINTGDLVEDKISAIWGQGWNQYWVMFSGSGVHVDYRNKVIDGSQIAGHGGLTSWIAEETSLTENQFFSPTQTLDIWFLVKGTHDSTHAEAPPIAPEFESICNNSLFGS